MNRLSLILFSFGFAAAAYGYEVKSPDGNVTAIIELDKSGSPFYSVSYDGKSVINDSRMGFKLLEGEHLESGFECIGESRDAVDETWTTVWGEETEIRNNFNELVLNLNQTSTGRLVDLRFRRTHSVCNPRGCYSILDSGRLRFSGI